MKLTSLIKERYFEPKGTPGTRAKDIKMDLLGEPEDQDDSYDFDTTPKCLYDDESFYGLCLDEDNQDELTGDRIKKWVEQLLYEHRDYKYEHLQD